MNNDDAQCGALMASHSKYIKDSDTHKDSLSLPMESTVVIRHEDGGPWIHRGG